MRATRIDGDRLKIDQSSPVVQTIVGLVFAGAGAFFLILFALGNFDKVKDGVPLPNPLALKCGGMSLCAFFILFGLAIAGYRLGTTLDREAKEAIEWETFVLPLRSSRRSIRRFTTVRVVSDVQVDRTDKVGRTRYQRTYYVKLTDPAGGEIVLGMGGEGLREIARQVADYLELELIDTTTEDAPLPLQGGHVSVELPVVGPVTYVADQPNVEVTPYQFRECQDQPECSDIDFDEESAGVTLTIPPAGIYRGSKGLFVFGLLWTYIVITLGLIVFGFMQQADEYNYWALTGIAFLVLLGPVMLARAIHMGRRRAVLTAFGDKLGLEQTGPFGSKEKEWLRDELADLRTGPSGTTVGVAPIIELQIVSRDSGKVGLFAGRDDEELRWLATVLRRALKFTETA